MLLLFICSLLLIVFGAIGLQFFLRMRALQSAGTSSNSCVAANRYRPMLRLLSKDDLAFVSADRKLRRTLRASRRDLFRGYLRCLTRDYSHLIAGVRTAMVQSGMDRPDLVRALAKNRVLFALAICKIEFRLALHATGVAEVDVSGVVDALESLRGQVRVLSTVSRSTSTLAA
jgi:hypothetical protein